MKNKNQVVLGGETNNTEPDHYQSPPLPSDLLPQWRQGSHAAPALRNVSIDIPAYYNVRLRKHWLFSMFLLGVFTQFAMAIYTPSAWNWIYEFLVKLLPVIIE